MRESANTFEGTHFAHSRVQLGIAALFFAISKAGLAVPVLVGLDGQTTTALHAAAGLRLDVHLPIAHFKALAKENK